MLRLHFSLAAARGAPVNGADTGTGKSLPRALGAPLPARPSPISGGVTAKGGGEPRRRREEREWRKDAENSGGDSVSGANSEAGSMVRKGQTSGTPRRNCADAEENQAGESDHSGYDTAVGYSDFYESFSECAGSPPSNGDAGAEDLRASLGSQAGSKAPISTSDPDGSSSSSVLLWEHTQPCTGDEAHYISTHEIQLYELDHDGECESGAGWDEEGSSAGYSCKDSSSFESDASEESCRTPLGTSGAGDLPPASGAVSPAQPVTGVRDMSPPKSRPENEDSGERLHLSTQADSQAGGEQSGAQEKRNSPAANVLESENQCKVENMTKSRTVGDEAKEADSHRSVPPRAGTKSIWKAFGNSSGTSSVVSELDDADKEVRSLTARTFRSLACAGDEYLDTFSGTSAEQAPEEAVALNRCATYIDLKCRNTAGGEGQVEVPTKSTKSGVKQGSGNQREESTHLPTPVNARHGEPADKQTSKKQLHLYGKFEQIGSRVITLTETLNFRYDVKEHVSGRRASERRVELARGVVGSRCADEITESTPREEGGESSRGIGKTVEAMDGAQKKSKFASNLLQNVIWKKMQFEQELKMERGEITDTSFAGRTSPAAAEFPKAPPSQREVEPNSNRLSGGSAETSPDPGESGGEAAPSDHPSAPSNARLTTGESGDGCRGTLQRSQHSAFRSWKEGEPRAPGPDSKPAQRVRAEIGGHPHCKDTKMSHLFVPSIHKAPGGGGRSEPPAAAVRNTKTAGGDGDGDTFSRSPEIKIRLRNVQGGGGQSPFSIAKLLTPKLVGGKGTGEGRCPAAGTERADEGRARAPPFTVRDVRDSIHKLQAPIHQVRDVRKLVKSSYHVLTLDGGGLGPSPGVEPAAERGGGGGGGPLPIVIKCQAVSRKEWPGVWDSEAAMKNGAVFVHRASGRLPLHEAAGSRAPAGSPPAAEKRGGGSARAASSNQLALEKLTAAVRSMEQLYVFDNNEWRRKNEKGPGPGPLAGSHVLSLIASEESPGRAEQEHLPAKEATRAAVKPPPAPAPAAAARSQDRDPPALPPVPPVAGGAARGVVPQLFAVAPVAPQPSPLAAGKKAAVGPPPDTRPSQTQPPEESEKAGQAASQQKPPLPPPPPEHENYLTIPVEKPPTAAAREPSPPVVYQHQQAQLVRLTPPISPGKVQAVPPVLMDSPSMPYFPLPQTQRRMLLDPATGQYYLVDTPVQPVRRRLYDPETGQYVDLPVPQQPVAPVPVPMSPIAFNPGTYGPAYMIYPGFLPPPTMLPTLPPAPDTEYSEAGKTSGAPKPPSEPQYLESPYYFPTGKSTTSGQTTAGRVCKGPSEAKPVISITSQQGPRIIAPPSFDGTTMSFVVEHR